MAGREVVLVVRVSTVPKTHLQETDQDRIADLVTVPPSKLVRPSKHISEQGVMVVKAVHGIIAPTVLVKLRTARHTSPILGPLDNLGKRAWSGIQSFPQARLTSYFPG